MILMGSYNMMGDNGNMFCCGNMIDDYNIIGIDNIDQIRELNNIANYKITDSDLTEIIKFVYLL